MKGTSGQQAHRRSAAGIDETLRKTGLDYLDMMIIHSPQPWAQMIPYRQATVRSVRSARS